MVFLAVGCNPIAINMQGGGKRFNSSITHFDKEMQVRFLPWIREDLIWPKVALSNFGCIGHWQAPEAVNFVPLTGLVGSTPAAPIWSRRRGKETPVGFDHPRPLRACRFESCLGH